MGVVKGLSNINEYVDAQEEKIEARKNRTEAGGDFKKTVWFKIQDKQSVKVIFLQELDANSPRYSQKNDLGVLAIEHVNPGNWKRKALCTNDDDSYVQGVCWACDQHHADFKAGWGQKNKLYINVLVDDGTNEPYVAVLSQGKGGRSITPALFEQAGEFDSITDTWYKIKRNGGGLDDTSYVLTKLSEHKEDVESYELFDIEGSVLRNVPVEKQEAFYLDGESKPVAEEPRELSLSSSGSNTVPW